MEQPKLSKSRARYVERLSQARKVENTKGQRPTGKDVGKLMMALDLPFDVFFEIASYLHPLDLLHLARASNQLRVTVMSREMRLAWIAARNNVEPPLPDCPEDVMSEPRYAALVFETDCMACGSARAKCETCFAARVRLCRACRPINVKIGRNLAHTAGVAKRSPIITAVCQLLPRAFHPKFDERSIKATQAGSNEFYAPEFNSVLAQYNLIASVNDSDALKDYIEGRRAHTLKRLEFKSLVLNWLQERVEYNTLEAERIRKERNAAIESKLGQLGFGWIDFPSYDDEFDDILNEPRPLTSREWDRIRPKLVSMCESNRVGLAKQAWWHKWEHRHDDLQEHYDKFIGEDSRGFVEKRTMPCFSVAINLPCMDALLTSDPEPGEPVTKKQFHALKDVLMQEVEDIYCAPVRRMLIAELRQAADPRSAGSSRQKASKKGKRKRRADEQDSDDEDWTLIVEEPTYKDTFTEADYALLDLPNSVFRCTSCDPKESELLTCNDVLYHISLSHVKKPRFVAATNAERELGLKLVKALGLPKGSKLSDIERLIDSNRGRYPTCNSCQPSGSSIKPSVWGSNRISFSDLVSHICTSAEGSSLKTHRITFPNK